MLNLSCDSVALTPAFDYRRFGLQPDHFCPRQHFMSAFDPGIDYLELLGLYLSDGERFSVEQIRQAIRAKRKVWTAEAINPLYQQQARRSLDVIRGFEKLLSRPQALDDYLKQLTQLHAQKRRRQEREIGNLVRAAVSTRGYLTTRQRDLLIEQVAEEYISAEVIDSVIERLGIELRSPNRLASGPPELPYEKPALDKTVLAQVGNWLKILEVSSFYELLDLPVYAPIATIRSQAEMLFAKWSCVLPKTTEVVSWEKSLQACLTWLKDDASREQYNHALFNRRIDQFVRRVDLVVAGGQVGRDDQIELTRIGTREFGLSSSVVSRCIQARVAAAAITLDRPVAVTVQMQGQSQCMRCYAWSPRQNLRCGNCGGTMAKRCANPFCCKKITSGSRACEHCQLRTADGRRFATLLSMGDSALRQADWETAIPAYRSARRILWNEQLEARLQRAGNIRRLVSKVADRMAEHALSAARETLSELVEAAPEADVPGLPTLETLSAQIRRLTAHCHNLSNLEDAVEAADMWSRLLQKWTDCRTAYHKLRFLCESLARDGESDLALEHAHTLLALRPQDDVLRRWTVKVQKWQSQRASAVGDHISSTHRTNTDRHQNGTPQNGTSLNGTSLNGTSLNGPRNGTNGAPTSNQNGVLRNVMHSALQTTATSRAVYETP